MLNSKAEPNLEVCVNGFCSSPPSGTSTSTKEVRAWPSGRNLLDSVRKAKRKAEEVLENLKGKDMEPKEVEEELVGERETLGGNGLLSISLSLYKAGAAEAGLPLWRYLSELFGTRPSVPKPLENFVGGGKHGGGFDVQEVLLFPEFKGSIEEWVLTLSEAYRDLKKRLSRADPSFRGALTLESAFVVGLSLRDVLAIVKNLADDYSLGLGMDVAASDLFDGNAYVWESEGVVRDREAQIDYIEEVVKDFGVYYVEDPLHEDDGEGFVELQRRIDGIVVGDDLFATNVRYLIPGVGGIIIKYNQRGSIVETVETVEEARKLGMKIIVSHRSGETEDAFLSHFAVAMGADFAKVGAAGIRVVKLNEFLRIGDV